MIGRYGSYARNFARMGWWETRFGMLQVNAPDMSVFGDWRAHYYPQRPPLSAMILSLWVRAFGDGEASLRLSLILLGTASILVFHATARRLLGESEGLLAAALFGLNPMFLYFSLIAVHYAYGLFFSLAAWAAALRIGDGRRYRVLLFACVALGCITDWPPYYAALSLAVYFWKGRRSPLSHALVGTAIACFGLNLLHRLWLGEEHVRRLLSVGIHHASVGGVPLGRYLFGEAREIGVYFTVGLVLSAGWGTVVLARARRWGPLCFALLGLEEVMFVRQAFEHDYLTFLLAPFFALAGAVGLTDLAARKRAVAVALGLLAAAQGIWIAGDRLTRRGGNEPAWRAAVVIRERTEPRDRVLLAMQNPLIEYYSDRYVAWWDAKGRSLVLAPDGPVTVTDAADLAGYVERSPGRFRLAVVGAAERARDHVEFFRRHGIEGPALDAWGFYPESHPLRSTLRRLALRTESAGPFDLYWLAP